MTGQLARRQLHSLTLALLAGSLSWPIAAASSPHDPNPTSYPGVHFGLLYDDSPLTLAPGHRTEILGPLLQHEVRPDGSLLAMPPLWSLVQRPKLESVNFDILYPLLTYDRYGSEYRFQLVQFLSFVGGRSYSNTNVHRFTLFPVYFQQRSQIPERNYTAVFPFYGRLQNRFFRDESRFVLWPAYVQSRKRDVVTRNIMFPLLHWRRGDGLRGWQFWPFFGHETKEVTYQTNQWQESVLVGGHEKVFALWPFFFNQTTGLGTTNVDQRHLLLPFFSIQRSANRDSFTAPWPLGYSRTHDRAKQYKEWAAPWPVVVFAHGPGKTVRRILPLFSQAKSPVLEQNSYAWPLYVYRRVTSTPLDRERTRILFFLYTDVNELNTETGATVHRNDLWPLYHFRHDSQGNRRFQFLAPLEPILPGNKNIERNYSPLWSLWRTEVNGPSGTRSHSLLWNLYRGQSSPESKKFSLLFGLFQYESSPTGRRWRLLYVPFGRAKEPIASETTAKSGAEPPIQAPMTPRAQSNRYVSEYR